MDSHGMPDVRSIDTLKKASDFSGWKFHVCVIMKSLELYNVMIAKETRKNNKPEGS